MERITKTNMARALAHYAGMLAAHGFMSVEDASRVTWAAPYGQCMYVVIDTGSGYAHDVPGFTGSGGSAFTTLREGYERVQQSASAIGDALAGVYGNPMAYQTVRDAIKAHHGVKVGA